MRSTEAGLPPWPDAFSETFVAGARALFDDSSHIMIVGPLGSNRGALAGVLAGPSAATAWGRDSHGLGADRTHYAVLNQVLPTVRVGPGTSVAAATAEAMAVLDHTFGRPVLCLREADLCDQGSIDVLANLVEDGRVRLVSTVDPSAASTHRFARSAQRIEVPPLDEQAVAALLQIRFSAVAHPTVVAMLLERSQGAYAVLKQFADASFEAGQIKVLAGTLVADESVTNAAVDDVFEASAARFTPRFGPEHPARDLLDVTSLLLTVDHEEAIRAFGVEATQGALGDAALELDDGALRYVSTTEGLGIFRDLDEARRRELFDRYAHQLHRSVRLPTAATRSARWLLSVGEPLPPDLALRAASQANRAGRYALVTDFIGSVPVGSRPSALLVEQCHALSESGADSQLVELIRSIDPVVLDDDDLLSFLRWSSRYLPEEETADLFESLRNHRPDDTSRRASLRIAELYGEVFEGGGEHLRKELLTLSMSDRLSPTGQALARSALSTSLRHVSRADQAAEMASRAVSQLDGIDLVATPSLEMARENLILCHIAAADMPSARAALVEYSAPGVGHGNLGRLGPALWGLLAFYSGDVGSALAQAQICLARIPVSDPHRIRGWAEAMAAQILTQIGDIDGVYDLLEASHRRPLNPRREFRLELSIAQACVHDAIGEPEQALDLLQAVVDEAHEHELLLREVDAAVLVVQIGGPVHLAQLLRAVEDVDQSSGTSAIWQRFAHAVRDNDMHALVSLAEELDADGRALYAAEVSQFTLDIARRAADMTPAQRTRLSQIADPMLHRKVTRA